MSKRPLPEVTVTLDKIVGGGQSLATMEDGRKLFVWGGLPTETVDVQLTKKKSSFAEGFVTNVVTPAKGRVEAKDPDSYMSTSPWQIMDFASEQKHKAALIEEAFAMHHTKLPGKVEMYSDNVLYGYRNKVEFSWYFDKETHSVDLSFFSRGTHRKLPVEGTSLASDVINETAIKMRDLMRERGIGGYKLKSLIIRSDQQGNAIMQLYVKDELKPLRDADLEKIGIVGFEMIFSNPKSPASVITKRLQEWGDIILTDEVLGTEFSYSGESFFQINLPVYEQALKDMQKWVDPSKPTVDMYSGVGTIGLTIGNGDLTMVEINESAVREMENNVSKLGKENVNVVLAPSEKALDYVSAGATIIVDPPRAGLDKTVTERLLEAKPERIIYLSCNPVTQARDVELLSESYKIVEHRGYNFFPRTPHIEHLVVLDVKK